MKDFFECPYRFKLISLYWLVFKSISETMGYGNSVHNILTELHRSFWEGKPLSDELLKEIVERQVLCSGASQDSLSASKNTAHKTTQKYFDENKAEFENITYAEKEIQQIW
ncbi:MAG: PD-(D/E)XK nuclease family protein [Crocinitomicaceae bacterium]